LANFENLHLNAYIAPGVLAVKRLVGKSITIGKSMLFSKDMVKKIKGFSALGKFLAEDHMPYVHIKEAKEAGLEIRHSTHVIDNININWSVERFLNRHLRWVKMRRNINIFHYLAEPLSNPVFIALIGLLGRLDLSSLTIFLTDSALKIRLDRFTASCLGTDNKMCLPYRNYRSYG
jgi:ceramide glucosyltransferase